MYFGVAPMSRPGVAHVSGGGDSYEEKLRKKLNGSSSGDTSSRSGVVRSSGDDAFEKRLRRKSALSANTVSVIDDSDRSGNRDHRC